MLQAVLLTGSNCIWKVSAPHLLHMQALLHFPLAWPPCYTLVHLSNWARQSVLVHCFPTDNSKQPLLIQLTMACKKAAVSKETA